MNICGPHDLPQEGNSHPAERQALATAIQVLAPELVLEVGTASGASARLFAKYVKQVLTMDSEGPAEAAVEGNLTKVQGHSPEHLDRLWSYTTGQKHWVFFHDGTHSCKTFTVEALWAFGKGADAVLCHDQNLDDMGHTREILKGLGYRYVNLIDLAGLPDAGGFTGVALFLPR